MVILYLAADRGSAEHSARIILPILRFLFPAASAAQIDALHFGIRKLGHLTEYAVLAALWLRAFVLGHGIERRAAATRAWMIAVAWAVVDEGYQTTVGSRTGSVIDVAIDAAGAFTVLALRRPRPPTP